MSTTLNPKNHIIQTSFGPVMDAPEKHIRLPYGIIGFPHIQEYLLTTVPGNEMNGFYLFQSVESVYPSFIILQMGENALHDEGLIKPKDLEVWYNRLNIDEESSMLFTIVTFDKASSSMSINLKAPLLIDLKTKTAWQIILDDPSYEVAYKL